MPMLKHPRPLSHAKCRRWPGGSSNAPVRNEEKRPKGRAPWESPLWLEQGVYCTLIAVGRFIRPRHAVACPWHSTISAAAAVSPLKPSTTDAVGRLAAACTSRGKARPVTSTPLSRRAQSDRRESGANAQRQTVSNSTGPRYFVSSWNTGTYLPWRPVTW